MPDHPRAMALLAQIARGLSRHGDHQTSQHLGDRSTYIGLSDVGRAMTCLRAAVASKVGMGRRNGDDIQDWLHEGQHERVRDALARQMILQRGHWLETGVESALRANGANLLSQLEISITHHGVPIRAHLDFVLVGTSPNPVIRVLELKSTEHLPQVLYPAYEAQIYGQIGLLKAFWDQPVFNLKNEQGDLILDRQTFPQICHQQFGVSLPKSAGAVDLEGWVLCLSMSEASAFGPYVPSPEMLAMCLRTAKHLWSSVQDLKAKRHDLNDLEICAGFHPLCDWCDFAEGCPKFTTDPVNDPTIDDDLTVLAELKADKAALDTEIDAREARVRRFCHHLGSHPGWLSTPHFRFKTSRIAGRKTIDSGKLRAELINRLGEDQADDLITHATNEGDPYERLFVTALKP